MFKHFFLGGNSPNTWAKRSLQGWVLQRHGNLSLPCHVFPEIAGLMKGSLSIIVPETSPNRALFSPFSLDHNSEARKIWEMTVFPDVSLEIRVCLFRVLNQFFMADKHLAPGRSRQWVTGSIYGLICSPAKK